MIKYLLIAAAIYIVYRLFANDLKKKKAEQEQMEKKETEEKIASGDMVPDPECGVYVSIEDAISVKNGKDTYYFCSYDCRDKFLKKLSDKGAEEKNQQKIEN